MEALLISNGLSSVRQRRDMLINEESKGKSRNSLVSMRSFVGQSKQENEWTGESAEKNEEG